MGYSVGGGGRPDTPSYKAKGEKLTKAIVIEEVKIIEVPKTYTIPIIKNVETEQVKYVTKEEEQVKYKTNEVETVKFNVKEQTTTRYEPKVEETIKFVPVEVKVEKPVVVEKDYEKPKILEKEYIVATVKDMANVRDLMALIPKLILDIASVKKELEGLRNVKLVEKIVEVPKIQWIPTPTERIVWKDVERERPSAS